MNNKLAEFRKAMKLIEGKVNLSDILFMFISYDIIHCKTNNGDLRITDNEKRETWFFDKEYIDTYKL